MVDLSLHLMDIMQNSVVVDSTYVEVGISAEKKKNLLTVFLHAPMEYRVGRVMVDNAIDSKNLAEKTIKKQDKARADYYNFFTHKKWGDAGSAMLSVDTSTLSADDVAEVIAGYAMLMQKR